MSITQDDDQYYRPNKDRINYKLDVTSLNVIGWVREKSLGSKDEYMDIFIVFRAKLYIYLLVYMDKCVWTLN